ncbi:hypothetical protein FKM82_017172 [Ascaphus truei]
MGLWESTGLEAPRSYLGFVWGLLRFGGKLSFVCYQADVGQVSGDWLRSRCWAGGQSALIGQARGRAWLGRLGGKMKGTV